MHTFPTSSRYNDITAPSMRRADLDVPALAAFSWLRRGARDLTLHPAASLVYGGLVTATGLLMLAFGAHPYFLAAALTGFVLVGPILGVGLCELSRRDESGLPVGFDESLRALRPNRRPLLQLSAVLALAAVLWFLVSIGLMRAWLGPLAPSIEASMWNSRFAQLGLEQWSYWIGAGAVFGLSCFALTVVAVPAIIDRGVSMAAAMRASLATVAAHPIPCLIWATLLAVLVVVAFASVVGLLLIFPLLGHATWHAYRDLTMRR
ncbi:DUF2189 domain-containing protein [Pseudomarimonas arenosa]|uniref:DUF2189 domain-containing protein n=1 Tax=Pseudomarimonas arenosa TaxID=2774145 RepID=A0AAW3ZH79_9GAMM|nr:DUF2189 domain-containing protein [Pseudomarimonas arenosa]MBD8524472.1 DUF2189 domain-containing protein [Pseudomarimonas arenosa]